jgi:hypothetical protein
MVARAIRLIRWVTAAILMVCSMALVIQTARLTLGVPHVFPRPSTLAKVMACAMFLLLAGAPRRKRAGIAG